MPGGLKQRLEKLTLRPLVNPNLVVNGRNKMVKNQLLKTLVLKNSLMIVRIRGQMYI